MNRDLNAGEFQRFHDRIYELTGIHYPTAKLSLLSNRIRRRLRACRLESYDAYLQLLQRAGANPEVQQFIDAITTNETYFFRCTRHWDFFRDWVTERGKVLPRGASLRIWSAAASSGAEAYTALIVMHQVLGSDFGGRRIELVGTDLSAGILEEARSGAFRAYALAQTSQDVVRKYFQKKGDEFHIDPALRKLATFQRHNLMEPMGGKPFDFVFLRNVMIYFDQQSKGKVLGHAMNAMVPGSYLLVGESESLMNIQHAFAYVKPSVFQKPVASKARV